MTVGGAEYVYLIYGLMICFLLMAACLGQSTQTTPYDPYPMMFLEVSSRYLLEAAMLSFSLSVGLWYIKFTL